MINAPGIRFDSFNQTTGADTRLVFLKNLVFNPYATQTRTPGFSSAQTNVGAGFDYQSNWLEVLAQRREVGANFNPEVSSHIRDWLSHILVPHGSLAELDS